MDADVRSFLRRPHLTKKQRLPRSYKEVEKILRDVKACRGTVRSLLNNSRLRGSALKKVYALSVNVLRNRRLLDKIIKDTQLLEREQFLREDLAEILVYELIFGNGLPGESRPVTAVNNYRLKLQDAYQSIIKFDSLSYKDPSTIPRYVRVNTLQTSVSKVINNFTNANYRHIQYGKETSEAEYLDLVGKLEPFNFMVDYHFKDLLVFSHYEKVQNWLMFKKNLIYIQDKSSYLPVFALDPKPGSTVLDACAAPGMKTIHIATIMENKGKIYAIERNCDRFEILKNMLNCAPVKICEAQCMDFYTINPNNPKYNSVEYILVDPSCSGSGMVNRLDPVTDTKDSKDVSRLEKLAGFQILLLKHALSFPSVKRVVYSTCSLSEEENEYVVHEVLQSFQHIFRLVQVMPEWTMRGMDEYKFGKFCLRADPMKTLTNGFFVAMFERMTSDEIQSLTGDESFFKDKWSRKKNKRKENWWPKEDYNDSDVLSEDFGSCSTSDLENSASTLNNDSSSSHSSLKKRKKVRVRCKSQELADSSEMSNQANYQSSVSIVTSENYSSESSLKTTSVFNNKALGEGHCSKESIHPDEFYNNDSKKNKQKERISRTGGNDYKSANKVCSPEFSKRTSNEKKINDYSSHNSDKLFQNKKKQQKDFFVTEEHYSYKIQNEFLRNDMNIPEDNSKISIDHFQSSKKKKKSSYVQDVTKRNFSDDSRDSKANFSHDLDEVENLTSQSESNKIEANKKKKQRGVKKIFDSPKSIAESEQTFEPQDALEKKHKKKHKSTRSAHSGESLSGTVTCTEQNIEPQETHGEKQKRKHTSTGSTEFGENVSYTEQTIETQDTAGKKRKKHYRGTESGETVSYIEQTVEMQNTPLKKHKKKHYTSPDSLESEGNVSETVSYTKQTVETQDAPGKKHKRKHYTITESTEFSENVNETVSCIVQTELRKKCKKKCKDKTKEE